MLIISGTKQPSLELAPAFHQAYPRAINKSSLKIKLFNLATWLRSSALFMLKLPVAMTVSVLKGSLVPLKTLWQEHFHCTPPAIVIEQPIVIAKPAVPEVVVSKPVLPYVLGAIALAMGIAAVAHVNRNLWVSENGGATGLANEHPIYDPNPPPISVMPVPGSETEGSRLSYALSSLIFGIGITRYLFKKASATCKQGAFSPADYAKIETSLEDWIKYPTTDLNGELYNIAPCPGDTLDLFRLLVEYDLPKRCIGDRSSFCDMVRDKAIAIIDTIDPSKILPVVLEPCIGNPEETCQTLIKKAGSLMNETQRVYFAYCAQQAEYAELLRKCIPHTDDACLAIPGYGQLAKFSHCEPEDRSYAAFFISQFDDVYTCFAQTDPFIAYSPTRSLNQLDYSNALQLTLDRVKTCFNRHGDDFCAAQMSIDGLLMYLSNEFFRSCNPGDSACTTLASQVCDFVEPCLASSDPTCQNVMTQVRTMFSQHGLHTDCLGP